jgi:hypothetical protein
MLKADFHSHSGFMACPVSWKRLDYVKEYYKGDLAKTLVAQYNSGTDVVALTSSSIDRSISMIEKAGELARDPKYKFLRKLRLLPAMEVTTFDGEILFIYPEDRRPANIPYANCHVSDEAFIEKIERAVNEEAAVILPHPFYDTEVPVEEKTPQGMGTVIFDEDVQLKKEYEEFFSHIHGLEVYNGTAMSLSLLPFIGKKFIAASEKSREVCEQKNVSMLGSSDNHSPYSVGTAYTLIRDEEPVKQIRERRTTPVLSTGKLMDPRLVLSQLMYFWQNGQLSEIWDMLLRKYFI